MSLLYGEVSAEDLASVLCDHLEQAPQSIQESTLARLHAATAPPDQPNYEIAECERIAWAKMDLDSRISELIDWIKENGPEVARARINALTRKFTISEEELTEAVLRITDRADVIAFVLDLRDRYEERGKYAPDTSPDSMPANVDISDPQQR